MVATINTSPSDGMRSGQNILIRTLEVPDLWVYSVESSNVPYVYTTDTAFTDTLKSDGYVQVGYYDLAALETQKVDLTDYYTKTEVDDKLVLKTDVSSFETLQSTVTNLAISTTSALSAKQDKFNILDYITYASDNSGTTITITGVQSGKSLVGNITIPAYIEGLPVTKLQGGDPGCFAGQTSLTSMTLPDTLTIIGDRAFQSCYSLASINIPKNVQSIGIRAFQGAVLTDIDIPMSVNTLGTDIFTTSTAAGYVPRLTNVNIFANVTEIPNGMFSGQTALKKLYLPKTITYVAIPAFTNVTLTDLYFGGTEDEFNAITNKSIFTNMTGITIHYNQKPAIMQDIYDSIDQTYDPTSTNAQSGVAVAEAVFPRDGYAYSYDLPMFDNKCVSLNGALSDVANYWATDLILCAGADSVVYSANQSSDYVLGVAFYTADATFISGEKKETSADIPATAVYLRLSGGPNDRANARLQFNKPLYTAKDIYQIKEELQQPINISRISDGSITRAKLADNFIGGAPIFSTDDLDDALSVGDYMCYSSGHRPPGFGNFGLSVRWYKNPNAGAGAYFIKQFAINGEGKCYVRIKLSNSNSFTEWKDLDNDHTKPLDGKTMAFFGDSITKLGNVIVNKVADMTGVTAKNFAFSGCRMSKYLNDVYSHFSMAALANSIENDDYTEQENALADAGAQQEYYTATLNELKATDFLDLDYLSIAYGTNDWNANVPLANVNDKYDKDTFEGAIRTALEVIYAANPAIRVFVCTPVYRFSWSSGEVVNDSDTVTNTLGLKLTDYVQAIKSVCEEYHTPVIDLYSNMGFCKFTAVEYYPINDGVHPNEKGRQKIGESIAKEMLYMA